MSKTESSTVMEKVLKHILKDHPENEPMIRIFGPILVCEEKLLSEHALKRKPNTNQLNDSNAPLLDVSNIAICPEKTKIFSDALLSTMQKTLPHLDSEIKLIKEYLSPATARRLCKDFLKNKAERPKIINDYIDKTLISCIKKDISLNTDANATKTRLTDLKKKKEEFYSIIELLLTRLSHLFIARATKALPKPADNINQNHCPYCGALPSMSIVHEKEGQRDLLCSSCGNLWRFKRTSCPNCLIEEQKNLDLVYQEKNTKERAIHCKSCNHYLLEVDIREKDISIKCANALSLGMSYLDAIMYENGAIAFSEKE